MAQAPLLFVNIGWMARYTGVRDDDQISGGFAHFDDYDFGHEAWNFAPRNQKLYGYVPGSRRILLKNFEAPSGAASFSGVTVVWLARHPSTRRTYIVGWYKNATIYDKVVEISRSAQHTVEYRIEAPVAGYRLLKPDERTFPIPTAKEAGNMGRSPVWYGGSERFRNKVRRYLGTGTVSQPAKSPPKQPDPELRKKIELAAVRHATRYYESKAGGSRTVKSVEKDCVGWDLTVTGPGRETLKVEVKGCSGRDCLAELTPNEFAQMRALKHRADYVVYIVTLAGTSRPVAHVFRYAADESSAGTAVWRRQDGRRLMIKEMQAARIWCE